MLSVDQEIGNKKALIKPLHTFMMEL